MTVDDLVAVVCSNTLLPLFCDTIMTTPRRPRRHPQQPKISPSVLTLFSGFLLGCIVCTAVLLGLKLESPQSTPSLVLQTSSNQHHEEGHDVDIQRQARRADLLHTPPPSDPSLLHGIRTLICIAAFDFSQLPHLEEVLDAYSDLCAAGALVDVIVHATVPYPVTLIDLLNTRLTCVNPAGRFTVTIKLVSPTVRLHLVDLHRPLFYEKLHDYDLFIYTEGKWCCFAREWSLGSGAVWGFLFNMVFFK
jgi:hypothetical protein